MTTKTDNKDTEISQMAMFVIDVLRYDIETTSSILKLLNDRGSIGWRFAWSKDFTEAEVIQALKELVRKGLVKLLLQDEAIKELVPVSETEVIWDNVDSLWFKLTKNGWQTWNQWDDPPREQDLKG
jgi:hypothetical protein